MHDYSEIAFDLVPYQDKTLGELGTLASYYEGHHQYDVLEILPLTQEVDEDWKGLCNILQAAIRKESEILGGVFPPDYHGLKEEFDSLFCIKRATPILFEYTTGSRLLYIWKQLAWVNPDDADTLVYVLTHGFQDKIPAQEDWVP